MIFPRSQLTSKLTAISILGDSDFLRKKRKQYTNNKKSTRIRTTTTTTTRELKKHYGQRNRNTQALETSCKPQSTDLSINLQWFYLYPGAFDNLPSHISGRNEPFIRSTMWDVFLFGFLRSTS